MIERDRCRRFFSWRGEGGMGVLRNQQRAHRKSSSFDDDDDDMRGFHVGCWGIILLFSS